MRERERSAQEGEGGGERLTAGGVVFFQEGEEQVGPNGQRVRSVAGTKSPRERECALR